MIKSPHIHSRHNHFCGAIWAAVHRAGRTMKQRFFVVQEPGHRRWLVTDRRFVQKMRCKVLFAVKSFRSMRQRVRACLRAQQAIDRWREALYREIAAGNTRCIPPKSSDHTREWLLQRAARENNTPTMTLLLNAGADANHGAGKALRIAVHRRHGDAIITLIEAGASILSTRCLTYFPEIYGTPRSWKIFLALLIVVIKKADLDESLPIFDELAEIAREPAFRPAIKDLATKYPALTAKLL